MLEERLNYLCILSRENNITKPVLYDEAIKEYAAKNVGRKTLLRDQPHGLVVSISDY
jgi:hypothetical protein